MKSLYCYLIRLFGGKHIERRRLVAGEPAMVCVRCGNIRWPKIRQSKATVTA